MDSDRFPAYKKLIQDSGFRIQVFFPEHEMIQLNGFRTGFQLTKNDSGFRIQVVPAYKK